MLATHSRGEILRSIFLQSFSCVGDIQPQHFGSTHFICLKNGQMRRSKRGTVFNLLWFSLCLKFLKNELFQSWLNLLKFSGMGTCPKTIYRLSGSSTKANTVLQYMKEKNTAKQHTDLNTVSQYCAAWFLLDQACTQIWFSYYMKSRQRSKIYSQGNQMALDVQKQYFGREEPG